MRRLALLLVTLSVGLLALSGCAKATKDRDRVLAAIDSTEKQAREFTYSDRAGGHTTMVKGTIDDDLRYRADGTRDGVAVASEVFLDDARALHVDDPATLTALRGVSSAGFGGPGITPPSPSPSPTASASPDASQLGAAAAALAGVGAATPSAGSATDALKAGQWVVDVHGAARLVAAITTNAVGKDPLFDALTSLEYVRQAANAATTVQLFNPESETYRPKLDPFPRPSAGTIRYDFQPPILTPHQGAAGQLQRAVPDTIFFRLMAVYVRDGVIVDVRERISVEARLQDAQSNLEARVTDFARVDTSAPLSKQAPLLLTSLNQQLSRTGQPPIRQRDMELKFTSMGHATPLTFPDGAVPGDLSAVGDHGQVLFETR